MRALLFSLALLGACAAPELPAPSPAPSTSYLAGTEWRRIDDENANPHGATMAFTSEGVSGSTGCNRWFTSVTHDGEALRFGNIGTTRRGCADVQAATERSFLAVLEATRYAHYDRDALVLLDANQQVIARFYRENP
jgi:heat shock protein HslJ